LSFPLLLSAIRCFMVDVHWRCVVITGLHLAFSDEVGLVTCVGVWVYFSV
jgi:hypothetical protein